MEPFRLSDHCPSRWPVKGSRRSSESSTEPPTSSSLRCAKTRLDTPTPLLKPRNSDTQKPTQPLMYPAQTPPQKRQSLPASRLGPGLGAKTCIEKGIEKIDAIDIAFAADLGYLPKLLALASDTGDGVIVRVHPTLIPEDHPLATVRGSQNAVFVKGPEVDELLFAGSGAGGDPTATAVLGDIITASRELLAGAQVPPASSFRTRSSPQFRGSRYQLVLAARGSGSAWGSGSDRVGHRRQQRKHRIDGPARSW